MHNARGGVFVGICSEEREYCQKKNAVIGLTSCLRPKVMRPWGIVIMTSARLSNNSCWLVCCLLTMGRLIFSHSSWLSQEPAYISSRKSLQHLPHSSGCSFFCSSSLIQGVSGSVLKLIHEFKDQTHIRLSGQNLRRISVCCHFGTMTGSYC